MRYAFLSMGILGALMAVADQPFATNKVISVTVGDGYILEELETGEQKRDKREPRVEVLLKLSEDGGNDYAKQLQQHA